MASFSSRSNIPNDPNIKRWNKRASASCDLCSSDSQTQLQMLTNCPVVAAEDRYTWKHDSILFIILFYLNSLRQFGYKIYGDLEDTTVLASCSFPFAQTLS